MLGKLLNFFKKKIENAEREDLDPYTGLPKHLVEKQELAFIENKLLQEGKEEELEKLERQLGRGQKRKKEKKRPFSNICLSCGFPYADSFPFRSPAGSFPAFFWWDDDWNDSSYWRNDDSFWWNDNSNFWQDDDDNNFWQDDSDSFYWDNSIDFWDSGFPDWNDEISLAIAGVSPYDEIYGFDDGFDSFGFDDDV